MPAYCDVAVPVPLPDTFTYRIPPALAGQVAVGGRVVVPFRQRKLVGVVTAVAEAPRVAGPLKDVHEVLDAEPLLSPALQELARWVAEYYLAPPGEVCRSMLPLHSEFAQRERARLRPLGVERLAELEAKKERSESERAEHEILRRLSRGPEGSGRNVAPLAKLAPHPELPRARPHGALARARDRADAGGGRALRRALRRPRGRVAQRPDAAGALDPVVAAAARRSAGSGGGAFGRVRPAR